MRRSLHRLAWTTVTLALFPASAAGAPSVLYVGDSLGVGTIPHLPRPVDGYARVGRTSSEGLAVLRSTLRRRHREVIFDLGSNDPDPAALTRNLRRGRRLSGARRMIVFTLNRPGARLFNRAVRAFASSARNVALIDWHTTARREGLLSGDGVHAATHGYRRRAALIARRL
jgi:hypothetical protein